MKLMASLFLATYPDANSPKIAANAVALVKQIDAALHAVAVNVDIPDVSNALSSYLLDLPNKIREVEATSRKCGKVLLEAITKEAAKSGVTLTTQELAAPPALMGDVAAKQSRYFDFCLVGWAPDNQTARMLPRRYCSVRGDRSASSRRYGCRCPWPCRHRLGRQPCGGAGCCRRAAVPRARLEGYGCDCDR